MLSRSLAISAMSLIHTYVMGGRAAAFTTPRSSCSSRTLLSSLSRATKLSKPPSFSLTTRTRPYTTRTQFQLYSTMNNNRYFNSMTGSMEGDKRVMQDMLFRVRECNNVSDEIRKTFLNFVVDGSQLGRVTPNVAKLLCDSFPSGSDPIFEMIRLPSSAATSHSNRDTNGEKMALTLSQHAGTTIESRTDAVMSVMKELKTQGIVTGWRDELYPVSTGFYDEPKLLVERAASSMLGILNYGVHINGLVKKQNLGEDNNWTEKMWVARRSPTKSTYPGMMDQIVAGGQPAGLGLMENVLKGAYTYQ